MFQWWKEKSKRWLAISLAIMLVSMLASSALQTGCGKVDMREIHTESGAGYTLSGMLYIPETATAETPAPAVVVIHGWWKGKEIQQSTAVELSRRGYVVFNVDLSTHGDADLVEFDGVEAFSAVQLLSDLPYVDSARIGGIGHSWGGFCLNMAMKWSLEDESRPSMAALMVAGTEPTYHNDDGEWENIYGARDIGIIASRYDDFEFHGGTDENGKWEYPPRDYIYSEVAKSFVSFGGDPAQFEGQVEPGRYYSQSIDGQESVRVIYTPTQIHSWNPVSPTCVGYAIDFFERALGAPDPIPSGSQIGMLKEIVTGIGLVGFVMFLISFAGCMMDTQYFGILKAEGPVEHWETPKGKGKVWFWASLIIVPIFSVSTIVPIATYFNSRTIEALPMIQANALGVWSALGGTFSLLFLTLFYFCYGRKNGVDLRERGVIIERKKLWRTILLALLVLFAAYSIVFGAKYFFKTDFRFWVLAVKSFQADKVWYGIRTLPFFLLFYIVNSLSVNCFGYNGIGIGKKEWGNMVLLCIFNAMSALMFTVTQYVVFFSTGESAFHSGAEKAVSGWLYAVIMILMITPIITRKLYKKTKSPYLAGIINGVIVNFMICGATSTLVSDISGNAFPF